MSLPDVPIGDVLLNLFKWMVFALPIIGLINFILMTLFLKLNARYANQKKQLILIFMILGVISPVLLLVLYFVEPLVPEEFLPKSVYFFPSLCLLSVIVETPIVRIFAGEYITKGKLFLLSLVANWPMLFIYLFYKLI